MSLGIAVGDFIAAGDLGWRLYRQVYRVARDAPEEVQALRRVLSETADVIRIVNEDLQLPDSPIARLGPERVSLASRIADETNRILKELEKLLEKTDLLSLSSTGARASQRAFWQRNWQKLRYAKDARHMNELRAKLDYQNGLLGLLLVASNNSSLERLQAQNNRIQQDVEQIKSAMSGSMLKGPSRSLMSRCSPQFQLNFTAMMMENAEVDDIAWSSVGLDNWLQAGRWWLIKAEAYLYTAEPGSQAHCDACMNLLKASWILTDVVMSHPQWGLSSSSIQRVDAQQLTQAISSEHKKIEQDVSDWPDVLDISSADCRIWCHRKSTKLIPPVNEPSSANTNAVIAPCWRMEEGQTLFQQFGYVMSNDAHTAARECLILLELKPQKKVLNLIAQSANGQDILYREITLHCQCRPESVCLHRAYSIEQRISKVVFRAGEENHLRIEDVLRLPSSQQAIFLVDLIQSYLVFDDTVSDFDCNTRQVYGAALLYAICRSYEKKFFDDTEARFEAFVAHIMAVTADTSNTNDPEDLWDLAVVVLSERRAPKYPGLLDSIIYLEMPERYLYALACAAYVLGRLPTCLNGVTKCSRKAFQLAIFMEDHETLARLIAEAWIGESINETSFASSESPFLLLINRHFDRLVAEAGYDAILLIAIKHQQQNLYQAVLCHNRGNDRERDALVVKKFSRPILNHDIKFLKIVGETFNDTGIWFGPWIGSDFLLQQAIIQALRVRCAACVAFLTQKVKSPHDSFLRTWAIPTLLTIEPEIFNSFSRLLSSNIFWSPFYRPSTHEKQPWNFLARSLLFQKRAVSASGSLDRFEKLKSPHCLLLTAVALAIDSSIIKFIAETAIQNPFLDYKMCMRLFASLVEGVYEAQTVETAKSRFQITYHQIRAISASYVEENVLRGDLDKSSSRSSLASMHVTICELLGLKFEIVDNDRLKVKGGEDDELPAPKALETQESYTAWRNQVIEIFHKLISFMEKRVQEYEERLKELSLRNREEGATASEQT